MSNWYSVEDKLPKEGEEVLARLVFDGSGKESYEVLKHKALDDNAPWIFDGGELSYWVTVTHWKQFDKLAPQKKEGKV